MPGLRRPSFKVMTIGVGPCEWRYGVGPDGRNLCACTYAGTGQTPFLSMLLTEYVTCMCLKLVYLLLALSSRQYLSRVKFISLAPHVITLAIISTCISSLFYLFT